MTLQKRLMLSLTKHGAGTTAGSGKDREARP